MISYTREIHTGRNTWGYEFKSRLLGEARIWITCNGERVDMTTMGYPKPYLLTVTASLDTLDRMDARERNAR